MQVAKIGDEVGRDVAHRVVDLLRLVADGPQGLAVGAGDGLQAGGQFVPLPLVIALRDEALWLAPLHVQKDAGIVTARTPGFGLAPVHRELFKGRQALAGGFFLEHQVALAPQPLVHTQPAVHLFRAVVRDDHDYRVVVQLRQQFAHQPVQMHDIVADGVFVGVAGYVLVVRVVKVLPKAVVDAVHAHLDEHEKVPGLFSQQVVEHLEAFVGHFVNLPQQIVLVFGAELLHVHVVGLAL